MSMKKRLDALSSEQRRRLIQAFDNHFAQHIELANDHFVGVNIDAPNFETIESIGCWSYGKIKRSDHD